MTRIAAQVCPHCMTAKRMHKLRSVWKCYICDKTFAKPIDLRRPESARNVAPMTYRALLAREALGR